MDETFPDIVQLNVGGMMVATHLSTLVKDENSMLAAMFSGRHLVSKDKDGRYFIDADGDLFRHILEFLRFVIEGDARRCFECSNVATPKNCEHIRECNAEEHCFTEQFVTPSGNVVYSTGCASKLRCSATNLPLIGKRLEHTANKRDTNISICTECCSDDFCNIKGCGISETPLGQRGPFCFNCDSMTDPKDCKRVTLCIQSEVCITYSDVIPGSQSADIRSRCTAKSTCDTAFQSFTGNTCAPYCCNTDFCNDQCGIIQTGSTVTQTLNQTTGTYTTQALTGSTVGVHEKSTTATDVYLTINVPTTTRSTFHCNLHGGYFVFQEGNVRLCIRLGHQHHTWSEAKHKCMRQDADLVVLDTYDKAEKLRLFLQRQQDDFHHAGYWIGLKDFSHTNNFEWVNGRSIDAKESDWEYGQPDGYRKGVHQHCVAMNRHSAYKWQDRDCLLEAFYYICERSQ